MPALLLAEVVHTWTDKEVLVYMLGAVGSTAGVLITTGVGVVKFLTARAYRRLGRAEAENRGLREQLDNRDDTLPQQLADAMKRIGHLDSTLAQVRTQAAGYKAAADGLEGERDGLRAECDKLLGERDAAEAKLKAVAAANADLVGKLATSTDRVTELSATGNSLAVAQKALSGRIQKALKLEGAIWTQGVMAGCPKFRPLAERKVPIVSVLNLKGGVGKTTLTAYLGWALAQRGLRVLLVDLDLQGSLSSLFIPHDELAPRGHDDGQLLRGYLTKAAATRAAKLLEYAVPSRFLNPKCRVVATTDRLAYAELSLTVQWLLRVGGKAQWSGAHDRRMILRRGLHAKGLYKKFDVVLLDCPPLVNMCCTNALAASDYVLTPVTPSEKAVERVSPLLRRVMEVKAAGVNPDLDMMGLVANNTAEKALTSRESDLFLSLPDKCKDVFKNPVHLFDTTVPTRVQIRAAEGGFAVPDSSLAPVFEQLAEEFIKRLPGYCCVEPTTAAKRSKTEGAR